MDPEDYIKSYCAVSAAGFGAMAGHGQAIAHAAQMMVTTIHQGGRIFSVWERGSAADAQHIAAELIGRFEKERKALPAIALTTDTSALTAIANDYDFDRVFARQLEGLGASGDLLIAISTSGNSANVIRAAEYAKGTGIKVVGLTGTPGGKLVALCDQAIMVPAEKVSHIQELHIAVGHMLCALVERAL